jgi:glutaredoxin 3
MALRLLEKRGAEVEQIRVDLQPELRDEMTRITGRTTVPQIFIGERHVGGYTELAELDMDDELEPLLNA